MSKETHLYRPLFILSVFLLLLNDLFLKYEFHNYLTGKLSDFAGLFAFPFFFSCIFPKRTKEIYMLTGISFIFWKSSFSQPMFDFMHSYGFGFDRVVDYSDLMALVILPISYLYFNSDFKLALKPNRILQPMIIAICCFAFVATTLPRKFIDYDYSSNYESNIKTYMDLDSIKNKLHLYDYSDNSYGYQIEVPDHDLIINTKIKVSEIKNGHITMKLDSIYYSSLKSISRTFWSAKYNKEDVKFAENLSKKEIEKLFESQIRGQFKK